MFKTSNNHPKGLTMKTYTVTFVCTDKVVTLRVECITAVLAVKIAHQRANEEGTTQNIEEIHCILHK